MYVYRCAHCPSRVALADSPKRAPLCESGAHADHSHTMRLLSDTDSALLPLDPPRTGTIGPMKVETLRAAGILLPETQDALEWMYRHRERNGMAGAFLKVQGRRCIDLVAFAKLMREQRA